MKQLSFVVDDFIDALLRDASVRVGLSSIKTKPTELVTLMGDQELDGAPRSQTIKMVAYMLHQLLNAKKLMKSFPTFFEQKMKLPFNPELMVFDSDKEVTLIELFRKKIHRFKSNFTYLLRMKYRVTISKGENHSGGKGKQLEEQRNHQDILIRRRQKRRNKIAHCGRVFYLNYFTTDGRKLIKVRVLNLINY